MYSVQFDIKSIDVLDFSKRISSNLTFCHSDNFLSVHFEHMLPFPYLYRPNLHNNNVIITQIIRKVKLLNDIV